jgi:hypothetical protein
MSWKPSATAGMIWKSLFVITLVGVNGCARAPSNPSVGTWHLNVSKSSYKPGPPPRSAVLTVDYMADTRSSVLETVTADGQTVRSAYAAKEDGKDYPYTGPNADTVSLRRTSPNTIERTDKRSGQVVMLVVVRLSTDGRTLTVTQKGVTGPGDMLSNTMVYEKR